MDRRVARTRNSLYEALVTLILRKGYPAITVQDLIDEANVGRATFYAHFTSKEDLLTQSLGRVRDLLNAAVSTHGEGWSRALLAHVSEFRSLYAAVSGIAAGDVLRVAIRRIMVAFIAQRLAPAPDIPPELQAWHVTAVFMTVISWWLDRQPDLDVDTVDALFRRLISGEAHLTPGRGVLSLAGGD
jgi:AcrR family transcriptional regulator